MRSGSLVTLQKGHRDPFSTCMEATAALIRTTLDIVQRIHIAMNWVDKPRFHFPTLAEFCAESDSSGFRMPENLFWSLNVLHTQLLGMSNQATKTQLISLVGELISALTTFSRSMEDSSLMVRDPKLSYLFEFFIYASHSFRLSLPAFDILRATNF